MRPFIIRNKNEAVFEGADIKQLKIQVELSGLNERSHKEYCYMCMYAVFILCTGHGVPDATRLLHQDHRLTAATERAVCVN